MILVFHTYICFSVTNGNGVISQVGVEKYEMLNILTMVVFLWCTVSQSVELMERYFVNFMSLLLIFGVFYFG